MWQLSKGLQPHCVCAALKLFSKCVRRILRMETQVRWLSGPCRRTVFSGNQLLFKDMNSAQTSENILALSIDDCFRLFRQKSPQISAKVATIRTRANIFKAQSTTVPVSSQANETEIVNGKN